MKKKVSIFTLILPLISISAQTYTTSEICQIYPSDIEGSFSNLMLTLDYSGSMTYYLYSKDISYNPNKIYFGYFDPFAAYIYNSTIGAYQKIGPINALILFKGKYQFRYQNQYGNNISTKYPYWYRHRYRFQYGKRFFNYEIYSGNYLNYLYMERIDLTRLILTGGSTIYVNKKYYLKFNFNFEKRGSTLHLEKLCELHNDTCNIEEKGDNVDVIFEVPLTDTLYYAICPYLSQIANNDWDRKHFLCHLLPDHYLRLLCRRNLMKVSCIEEQNESSIVLLQLEDGIKLVAKDSITYNPTTQQVEGILQWFERLPYKPRIGGIIFSNSNNYEVVKYWAYPSYYYNDLISAINKESPGRATPTGAALNEIKRYFSLEDGLFNEFNSTDISYINPYTFKVNDDNFTIVNSKNISLLISDGAWNGYAHSNNRNLVCEVQGVSLGTLMGNLPDTEYHYNCAVDPAEPAYEMWKGSFADLTPLDGNQNVETLVVASILDNNSLALNALRNIAIAGGFIDKDGNLLPTGFDNEPPSPQCNTKNSPNCGSYLDIPALSADSNQEWHNSTIGEIKNFYYGSDPYSLYKAILNSFKDISFKIQKVSCLSLLEKPYIPSAYIADNVINMLYNIKQFLNNENFENYRNTAADIVYLTYLDLLLARYKISNLEEAIKLIEDAQDITELQNAINNAIATIYMAYKQTLFLTAEKLLRNYKAIVNNNEGLDNEESLKLRRYINYATKNYKYLTEGKVPNIKLSSSPQEYINNISNMLNSSKILLWLEY